MEMKTSKLWEGLAKDKFAKIDDSFLRNFREPGGSNNRLAAWDPFDKSMRYFKFLFYHQLQAKEDTFFANYAKIGQTLLGNPVTLPGPSELQINLDHFFSIEEFTFLNKNLHFDDIAHVLEIGAGFGRTAQALIKLVRNIERYTIVDIPEVLSLSCRYLEKVLSEQEFSKLSFINAFDLRADDRQFGPLDLVINIDSFQEMTQETITFYLERIVRKARFFYSKNAVGKYRPESVGLYDVDENQLMDVFSLGLSRDVIDIFSTKELSRAREKHVMQYRPAASFGIVAQEPLGIFPYYLNVLYGKV